MAAVMVLLEHVIKDFLASVQPVQYDSRWLTFVTEGHFAVAIFFVLSGYVLSLSQVNSTKNLFHLFISRYCRLALPILVTCTITYFLLVSGLFYIAGTYYQFTPTIMGLLKFSLFDVFFNYDSPLTYSPALWTMSAELLGSYALYGLLRCLRGQFRYDILVSIVVAFALLFFKPYIACFIFGYLIAELNLRYLGVSSRIIPITSLLAFISVVGVVSMSQDLDDWLKCLLASVLIVSVSYSPLLKKAFTNSVMLFLGKISFALYLIQFTVIGTLSAYITFQFRAHEFVDLTAANINLAITIVACILFAYLLTPLDTFSIQISKKIGSLNFKRLIGR